MEKIVNWNGNFCPSAFITGTWKDGLKERLKYLSNPNSSLSLNWSPMKVHTVERIEHAPSVCLKHSMHVSFTKVSLESWYQYNELRICNI